MLLFCVKSIVKESRKFEERKTFWPSGDSGSVLSQCLLAPLGMFFVMKTLENEC